MPLHHTDHRAIGSALRPTPRLAPLRFFCLVEAATLLVLVLVAVPLKYLAGYPLAVSLMGPIHGFAFIAFGWVVVQAAVGGDISWRQGSKLMLAASLPLGGIYSWWALR